jgi:hypothetical protein
MSFQDNHPLLYKISNAMDAKFEILGIKFGFDFLIGLIPVWGNLATTFVSLFTVGYSALHGVSIIVPVRMLLNISVDIILTAIPVLGNFADIFWKANTKNYQLLERYDHSPEHTVKHSIFVNIGILASYLAIIALIFYGLYRLVMYIVSLF